VQGRDDLVRWLLDSWVRCCAALRLTLLPAMRATCDTFRALRVRVTLALIRSALCDCLASMRYGCCHMSLPSSAHSLLLPSLVASALQPAHGPRLRRKRTWNVYSCLRLVAALAIARRCNTPHQRDSCGGGGCAGETCGTFRNKWSSCMYF
jgi:hypothetical protein